MLRCVTASPPRPRSQPTVFTIVASTSALAATFRIVSVLLVVVFAFAVLATVPSSPTLPILSVAPVTNLRRVAAGISACCSSIDL